MSNLPDEYREYRGVSRNLMEQRAGRIGELKKIQADAEQISQLVADPRWEFYGRYLEVRKKAADMSIKAMEGKMLHGFLSREEYGGLSVSLAEQRGLSAGLDFALVIAELLITQGQKAVDELMSLTSDEK